MQIEEIPSSSNTLNDGPDTSVLNVNTRSKSSSNLPSCEIWDEEGSNLFDVKCEKRVMASLKAGLCFDQQLYEDQKGSRKYVMVLTKVTKEFMEEDKNEKRRSSSLPSWSSRP